MPAYLLQGSYTGNAAKGLGQEGGSSRAEMVKSVITGVGGTLTSPIYYGFGEGVDIIVTVNLPSSAAAVALTLITAPGGVSVKTTCLMAPSDIDEASKLLPNYRAPGQ